MPVSDYPAYLDIDQQQWTGIQRFLKGIRVESENNQSQLDFHSVGADGLLFTISASDAQFFNVQAPVGDVDSFQSFQDGSGFLAVAPIRGSTPVVGNGTDPPASGFIGAVNRTAQSAAVAATKLTDTTPAGYYLVHYTLEDTTADIVAGTIQFQINYTDHIGATTQTGAALALTATGRDRGSFNVYLASGDISYQTNLVGIIGTARYALTVRCTYLG